MKTIVSLKWGKQKSSKFVEYGFDPENNKYLIGVSTEIENTDGTEMRIAKKIPIKVHEVYIRIWILKLVLCIGTKSISIRIKNRFCLKFILGFAGE